MGGNGRPSPSSSIDSSCSSMSTTSSLSQARELSTELRLGFSMSTSTLQHSSSKEREKVSDWPPIKPLLRSTLLQIDNQRHLPTLFVKVYMEGFPIGRKLDLCSFSSYDDLLKALCHMFRTTIICPEIAQMCSQNAHVLTYEDKEGDWMMVGDVPWKLFLTTVKRMKITRADKC